MATRQRKAARTTANDRATDPTGVEEGVTAVVEEAQASQPLSKRRRGPHAGTERARRGGMAVREKYGAEFFARIGAKGGKSVSSRRGPDFYAGIGHKGGSSTRDRLGVEHYERIGRMGGLRQRQRERLAAQEGESAANRASRAD